MHDGEESDGSVVPKKRGNNSGTAGADRVEGSDPTLGNPSRRNAPRTQCREQGAPSELERIRQAARRDRRQRFTALLHHVTMDRLREAYRGLKTRAAPGVDGVTWVQYGEELEGNLQDLLERVHRGAYRAKGSRRAYIPKADGRQRPLGVAAMEDKVLQAALVEVLNAVYEEDFLGFSYGFRPGRGPHDALDALTTAIKTQKVNWVLDADIRGFFDAIVHGWLVKMVQRRIGDPRVVRLIQKWLAAGVLEEGQWTWSEQGTPQGATISPLLANVFLHYVLDRWAHRWRQKHAQGDVVVLRYADDFVVGFETHEEAERFLIRLRERFRRFGLELHPDKTRLIEFGRYAARDREQRGDGKPESFTFLGLRHICSTTRDGAFQVARHTDAKRLRAKLSEVQTELRRRMHHTFQAQGRWLRSVVTGYFRYHAVHTNIEALTTFREQVRRRWYATLRRRSHRTRVTWERIGWRIDAWLPPAKILHDWPEARFARRHPT